MLEATRQTDPDLAEIMDEELERQCATIEMIASESIAPLPVMELSGSVFTNKTLEGYPGNRFQAGAKAADRLEALAIERAKELFGADHANIQPYSGTTANYAVFAAVLSPGDKILSMRLDQGGHLTHGSPANWTSKIYRHEFYGVSKETEAIDYAELERKALSFSPKLIIAGASSYPRLIDYEAIAKAAQAAGAIFMVDMAHIAGLVAAKAIPSPVPYADFVTSSTTKTFCGGRSGMALCRSGYAKALDKGVFPGALGSMHLNTMAAKCWSFKHASTEEFRQIMLHTLANAKALAKELEGFGFRIVSGGTDTHLLVADVRPRGLNGRQFQDALDFIGISVNKNMIPFDEEGPSTTSGIRIGLTSVTQRGFREKEIALVASLMDRAASSIGNEKALASLREEAKGLIQPFPLYPEGALH
jgi:glycine hydroxymethyltransferase